MRLFLIKKLSHIKQQYRGMEVGVFQRSLVIRLI